MGQLRRIRPKSRQAWRDWLEKNHASSQGVWLVYAKKHETRARYLRDIIESIARNLSDAERMAIAGFRPKPKPHRAK